jgi:23S rRNA (guanine745-N1)-methyltransferase
MNLICPHCHTSLEPVAGAVRCARGHSFDVAREGYVNLLTGRQKSGTKGDTPAMLAARTQFFAGGYYEPLRAFLMDKISHIEHATIAEIGCGQGYYIGGIAEHKMCSKSLCLGTDIAKEGIRQAAKNYPNVQFAVADTNTQVPLPDHSVDVLLDIFAPRNAEEFARVLRPGGHLLVVIPTQKHLAKLRDIQPLLAIQQDKRRAVEGGLASYLRPVSHETLTVPLVLDGAAVRDLVEMTPNAWFLTDDQRATLAAVETIKVTAEFEILDFVA